MKIAVYTLTSELHDEQAVGAVTQEFLGSLNVEYEFCGNDYADYGSHDLDLIYVRTGGTEGILKRILPRLREHSRRPFYFLTSGKNNSLAASMEILSYLRQQGVAGEIIHGSSAYISGRIELLAKVGEAYRRLEGCRLGVIGQPSDWLISSSADTNRIQEKLGIELVDIPMQELLNSIAEIPPKSLSFMGDWEAAIVPHAFGSLETIRKSLPGAVQIYQALKHLVERYRLQGLTLRRFDLLTAVHNTGCLALARLNAEGIVAGCEGDVPAMLSMKVAQAVVGVSGFQANPASIDPDTGEILFAHCTIPLNMVEHYELDTHFESGIGVAIRGYMQEGNVTLFKLSGDLSQAFIEEGYLIRNQAKPNLCRTQQVIRLKNASRAAYFLTEPIGNHHIILPGLHKAMLKEMLDISRVESTK